MMLCEKIEKKIEKTAGQITRDLSCCFVMNLDINEKGIVSVILSPVDTGWRKRPELPLKSRLH